MTISLTIENADPALIAQIAAILPKDAQPTANAAPIPAAPSTPAQPSAPVPQALPSAAPAIPAAQTAPVPPTAQTASPAVQQMFGAPTQQQIPTALPQSAPKTYTVQELCLAARPLVEMGRQQDLMSLLAEFGAPSVAELPEGSHAAFAAKLRAMGGQI